LYRSSSGLFQVTTNKWPYAWIPTRSPQAACGPSGFIMRFEGTFVNYVKGKGKVHTRTDHEGTEGE